MYHFIVNIHGGSGKAFLKWNKIRELLKKKKVEFKVHVPQRVGHAMQIAKEVSSLAEDDIKIVVVGGDGTINEVLNGITDFSRIKLGLIPTGSGNDFARGVKIPRHNQKKALDIILKSKADKKIDLGRSSVLSTGDSRIFAISSGFGLDAIVGTGLNQAKIKKILNWMHLGALGYVVLTVQTLFTMKTYSVSLKFDDDEPLSFNKLIFLAAMNFKAEGGGVPMCPKAKGDDGLLSICMAAGVPKVLTFLLFPLLCMGLHGRSKGFYLRNCKKLVLESDSKSILHTDGELVGNVDRVQFEVLPQKLTMLI
ncbi:diacylglycerol kinase family lipid kinase [Treponema ruminis]|uniref:YegS/Rv2252/BmrU family lipid kinase n=1 Tax=Treponema ruminis TaxID=744515 RepID=A0A7W8G948_9SPIR|nr:diacylglycerol kinase family protein [Treponema ruminis]MBB5226062.1 YegS/Rv2252/BmrU family lipid kinase [Treponema ruminis]QSI03029.1 diacylglycerol kinase family lipid kinase [Treponema ruminis]